MGTETSATATTVVVGLGNIGGAVGARIATCGEPVIGVESDDRRREQWCEQTDATAVASLGEVPWSGVARVLVTVRLTDQALSVLASVRCAAVTDLACHLMTTMEPLAAQRLSVEPRGRVRVLEQPVSGGAAGARDGSLTVLSAGPATGSDDAFLRRTIAGRLLGFSEYGQPTLAKLINNAAAAYHTRTTASLVSLAARSGLDPTQFKSVLDSSSGASVMGTMLAELADEQADLLTKDVALLATATGPLPGITVQDRDGFLADLRDARNLLRPATAGRPGASSDRPAQ